MLGVENEAGVENLRHHLIRNLFGQHVEEIFGVVEVVARLDLIVSAPKTGISGDDGGNFGDQTNGRKILGLLILDILIGIEHPERRDRRLKRIHRVTVVGKTFDQIGNAVFDPPVHAEVFVELLKLGGGRQVSEEEKVGRFDEVAPLGQGLQSNPRYSRTPLVPSR